MVIKSNLLKEIKIKFDIRRYQLINQFNFLMHKRSHLVEGEEKIKVLEFFLIKT